MEKGAQVGPLLWSRGLKGCSVSPGEAGSEAGGRRQGTGPVFEGTSVSSKGISGPELARLFGFVQLLRVLDVRPEVSHRAPPDISFLVWSVGLIIGSRSQNCCEGYVRQRAFN